MLLFRMHITSHSAYDAMSTKSNRVKIDVDSKRVSEKFLHRPPLVLKNHPVMMVEEFFAYFFGIYIKFGCINPSILTLYDSVDVAT